MIEVLQRLLEAALRAYRVTRATQAPNGASASSVEAATATGASVVLSKAFAPGSIVGIFVDYQAQGAPCRYAVGATATASSPLLPGGCNEDANGILFPGQPFYVTLDADATDPIVVSVYSQAAGPVVNMWRAGSFDHDR